MDSLTYLILFCFALSLYPTATESYISTRKIDEDLHYSTIHPFQDEWIKLFNDTDHHVAEPFHFWFRCIGREVRAYLFIEDLRKLSHGKEADMPIMPHLSRRLKYYANGRKIDDIGYFFGGGDLYFNISSELSSHDNVDITIDGFKHFARFPVSICTPALPKPSINPKNTKYLMHIHLREFRNASNFNRKVVRGIVKHMLYHRCALKLDQYEVVIQAEQLQFYLVDPDIVNAIKAKWITFILRNPFNPEPILMSSFEGSNCYWQAYVENLNLLHYWKQNVKIYYFDSDEYLWISNDLSSQSLFQLLQSHPVLGFKRYMTFCYDCNHRVAELKSLSFQSAENDKGLVVGDRQRYQQHKHHVYKVIEPPLDHPKLLVNPNAVGCYIVHWAGCGASPYNVPPEMMFITHFENLYVVRWKEINEEYLKPHRFLQFTNVHQICDPSKFHWDMEKYPSYHYVNSLTSH
jgi:hypothetical protein